MALRINQNIPALTAQRGLASAQNKLAGNFRRLSTGLRISTAADDAAGLSLSERLRAQVRSLNQANRNASDGISLVQAAEGALSEVSDILTRLRELAVQSANGTISSADRATLDDEFQELVSEVDRIGRSTEFNGIQLLDGSTSSVSFHVGTGTDPTINSLSATLSAVLATGLGIDVLELSSASAASSAMTAIDTAIETVSRSRGRFGAMQNRLQYTVNNLETQAESMASAESRIRDADVAYETAQLARNKVLQEASLAMLAQANLMPELAMKLLEPK